MILTKEHLLELIDELPKNQEFEYVKPGKNRAKLIFVDKISGRIEMARVAIDTKEETSSYLNEDNLQIIIDSVIENRPFSIDKIFNNGGNTRSVWESVIANTSEFYKCMVGRNKNLVWIPTRKKTVGNIVEIPNSEIPNSGKKDNPLTDSIRDEFEFFLAGCVKSSRSANNILGTLGETATRSYLSMLDKKDDGTIKLFDYNSIKWSHIQDIYQITDSRIAERLFRDLLNDQEFVNRDNENKGWRSGALNLYVLFLRARTFFLKNISQSNYGITSVNANYNSFRPYITAIKSKPFLLLAGISGTGKSRIVRELARACWEEDSEEYNAQKPQNFTMIQVKPNWHDSSELIGYVSRVSGEPVFVTGDFLKFVARAWENPDVPHFLCLDEMNLAPVEQYFAEYLSVIESRKNKDGKVVTDAILEKCSEQWYFDLTAKLTEDEGVRTRFLTEGITIPQNLIVVGTVNMDETTFSFSRKVLDRAMTIEMNEVDLTSGLDRKHERIGLLGQAELIGPAVEGVDVYNAHKGVCDKAIGYLTVINKRLENTPFKVAYRTRNEVLLYVVNNLPYNKNEAGQEILQEVVMARALDEITNMKILSRIEGDETKIGTLLNDLKKIIGEQLNLISGRNYSSKRIEGDEAPEYSVSLAKLEEMDGRLKQGYTSFWS